MPQLNAHTPPEIRLALACAEMRDGDVPFNLLQIEQGLAKAKREAINSVFFGEAFMQGFEGLSWNHAADLAVAFERHDPIIQGLQAMAKQYHVGLGFGYYEKAEDCLYSSYLVLSPEGEQLCNYRRLSTGWKEPCVLEHPGYCEGKDLLSFQLGDRQVSVAICGDLWHDEILERFQVRSFDALLWPLYIDYDEKSWLDGEREEYAQRVAGLKRAVWMVNSYTADASRARGGAYVFSDGAVIQELPMGRPGLLLLNDPFMARPDRAD